MKAIDVLNKYKSQTTGKWREDAEYRRKNARWLRYSAMISIQVRDRMAQIGMTQAVLAEKLGCTQQHVSMLLKGKNNMTVETIAKLEEALEFDIIGNALIPVDGYSQNSLTARNIYLSDSEHPPYGDKK